MNLKACLPPRPPSAQAERPVLGLRTRILAFLTRTAVDSIPSVPSLPTPAGIYVAGARHSIAIRTVTRLKPERHGQGHGPGTTVRVTVASDSMMFSFFQVARPIMSLRACLDTSLPRGRRRLRGHCPPRRPHVS